MSQLPPGFVLDGQAPAPAPAPRGGPVYGAPAKPDAPREAPAGYRWGQSGSLEIIPGGPADPNKPKPVDAPSGYRFGPGGTLEAIPGGPADPSKPKAENDAAEGERNNKAYYEKAIRALQAYDKTGVGPRTYAGAAIAAVPGGEAALRMLPDAIGDNPDRLISEQAKKDFAQSVLRSDSGANAPEPEVDRMVSILFPGPGETDPAVIANYAAARQEALVAMRAKAGRLAGGLENYTPPTPQAGEDQDPDGLSYANPGVGGAGTVTDQGSPPPPSGGPQGGGDPYSLSNIGRGLGMGLGDIAEGVGDAAGIVVNPIATVLGRSLGYDGYTADFGKDVREALNLPDNTHPVASAINKGGVGALTGSLAARGLSALATSAPVRNAMLQFGATPGRDMLAGAGAGAGGEIGREVGGVPGQVIGSLAGGLAGYSGGNALLKAQQPRSPTPLAEAATRQNVDLLPADSGGPVARAVTTGTKASPISVGPVVKSSQRQQGQMADATRRISDGQGGKVDTEVAGRSVRNAAERFTKDTSERGSRLYTRAGEASKGVRIKPVQTIGKLDDYIARVRNNPASTESGVAELEKFRDNIANGVNVAGLRDARTSLSQGTYDGKLRSGPEKAMWKDILDNLSSDIENGLTSVGKNDAAAMFKQADRFWRERVEHIDEVLQPLLGKDRGGEEIVTAIERMSRGGSGGNARLSRLLGNMTKEEAGQVRATIIDRIGKATAGAQNAEGTAFSASTFLTNWNKMTPQGKASLFSDKGLRSDLNDIAMLADGMKASQSMANHSNTGIAIGANAGVGGALIFSHPVAALVGAGTQYLTGRLMASPGFARILARGAKLPPEVASRKFGEQLKVLAAREPLIANDLGRVQQAIAQSPVARAAAEDQHEDVRREPPSR